MTKYLYISNGNVTGYANNSLTETKNGNYVLRYVIGV